MMQLGKRTSREGGYLRITHQASFCLVLTVEHDLLPDELRVSGIGGVSNFLRRAPSSELVSLPQLEIDHVGKR